MASNEQTEIRLRSILTRSSCCNCADAKIGCSKERPTCSRCLRRGEQCVYAPIKRAGRPSLKTKQGQQLQQHRQQQRRPDQLLQSTYLDNPLITGNLPNWPCSPSNRTSTDVPSSDLFNQMNNAIWLDWLGRGNGLDPGTRPDLILPLGEPLSWIDDEISSAPISPSTIPRQHTASKSPIPQADWFSFGHTGNGSPGGVSSLDTSSNTILSGATPLFSTPSSRKSPPSALPSDQSPCDCFNRSLNILAELSPATALEDCSQVTRQGIRPSKPQISFEAVMTRNKIVINSCQSILDCQPCTNSDNSLLFVLGLITSKVLGWYAACAAISGPETNEASKPSTCRLSIHPPSSTSVSTYSLEDDKDPSRVICQLVFSELQNVQRVVKDLSQRLQSVSDTESSIGEGQDGLEENFANSLSLSQQMGKGLRNNMHKLYHAIVDTLVEG